MKKIIATIALAFISASVCFCQLKVENPSNPVKSDSTSNQGFYVNEGKLKLTQLECYNFGDMVVAFDNRPEFFNYDYIYVKITCESNGGAEFIGKIKYNKETFKKLYGESDYSYFYVFYTKDLAEESRFKFKRANLEYANSLLVAKNSELKAVLIGSMVQGTKTTYSTTASGNVEATENEIESYSEIAKFSIPLLNRKKAAPIRFGSKQDLPTVAGDCYK